MVNPYVFAGLPEKARKSITIERAEDVVLNVCRKLGVAPKDFFSKSRSNMLTDARMIACKILRDMGYSNQHSGSIVGKDRTTVLYYLDKFDAHYKVYKDFKEKADLCIR